MNEPTTASDRHPTAFISYSWDSEEHQAWVMQLAADLRQNGVDVTLDRWDLRIGDDIPAFMERIVDADHTVLVCTERYAEKADGRSGGVGWEYTVLTGDLTAGSHDAVKLVPILRRGHPSTALPRYLKTRLFVDFRDDARYPAALDQLVRHLWGVHVHGRPPLAPRPAFDREAPGDATSLEPRGWVLTAGTGRARDFSPQQRETSERLGQMLGEAGYGLVTGGWPGVDERVARSFAAEVARGSTALEDVLVQVVDETELPEFPAGDLILVRPGPAEWTAGIRRADVVVLIGGLGGTWTTGELALEEGTVVLPLADTGGDAKRMYLHMLKHWDELPHMHRLSRSQFQTLGRPAPEVVGEVARLLARLSSPAARDPSE